GGNRAREGSRYSAAMPSEGVRRRPRWKRRLYACAGAEVSAMTRFADRLVWWKPLPHDDGALFDAIECPEKSVVPAGEELTDFSKEPERVTTVLLNGNFNYDFDIQALLSSLKPKLARSSRVAVVTYNSYL